MARYIKGCKLVIHKVDPSSWVALASTSGLFVPFTDLYQSSSKALMVAAGKTGEDVIDVLNTADHFELFTIPGMGIVDLDVVMKFICFTLTVASFMYQRRSRKKGNTDDDDAE